MEEKESLLDIKRERWFFKKINQEEVKKLSEKLGVTNLIAKILLVREIGKNNENELNHFLYPPESLIFDTSTLSSPDDMKKTLERLASALNRKEKIMVNGDPDADGITGTAVLVAGLRYLGGLVLYDFPTRSKEGHGIQPRIINEAVKDGCKVLITADCGTKDVETTEYASSLGLDVIICDHHILGRKIPGAFAFINPQRCKPSNCHALSGSGVAFKLIVALFQHLKQDIPNDLLDYLLALASLGTISDRMSILDPTNRIIVKRGIEAINRTPMKGLKALKEISADGIQELRSRDIPRTIVPRLNAPGRIGDREEGIPDASLVVDLLLIGLDQTKDEGSRMAEVIKKFSYVLDLNKNARNPQATANTASVIEEASTVDDVNEKRKYMTSKIEDEIDLLIQSQVNPNEDKIIIIRGQNWNPGVIGIDTDRLKDRFLRPAIILTEFSGHDYIRGSARSIPLIDIYHIIDMVSDRFEHEKGEPLYRVEVDTPDGRKKINAFGGHSQACGFTLHREHIPDFVRMVREEVAKLPLEKFKYSYEIVDTLTFSQLQPQLIEMLDLLTPYGTNFEFPIFYLRGCSIGKGRPFGNRYQEARTPHVDFSVMPAGQSEGRKKKNSHNRWSAVGFGLWEKFSTFCQGKPNATFDIIFTPEFSPRRSKGGGFRAKEQTQQIRLNVLDIRESKKG